MRPSPRLKWRRPDAEGEGEVTRELERRTAGRGVVLLHDRQMPRGWANIDHIAIGPSGVTVLQARIEDVIVDGVLAQADAVRGILADGPHAAVAVRAVLCFADGDWPWSGPLELSGVPILTPRRAAKLCAAGVLPAAQVTEIADVLKVRLAPA